MNNVIQTLLPKDHSNLSLQNDVNPFSGALSASNSDLNFEEITTGDAHTISEITAADPAVITFGGGSELHTDANAASIGNEADATTGWQQFGLDVGANVFESQGAVKSTGSYAIHGNSNDTPTSGSRIYFDIGNDFSLVEDSWYTLSFDIRHTGANGTWDCGLDADTFSAYSTPIVEVDNTDTVFATQTVSFQYDSTYRYLVFRESSGSNDGGVYIDALSVKLLHDYNTTDNSVISIGACEGLGAELVTNGDMEAGDPPTGWIADSGATLSSVADERSGGAGAASVNVIRGTNNTSIRRSLGTLSVGWYRLDGWVKNGDATSVRLGVFGTSLGIKQGNDIVSTSWTESDTKYFEVAVSEEITIYGYVFGSSGEYGRFDDLSVKQVIPVKAKPIRIASIDANGVCTTDADYSDLAAAITSAFAVSATLTNYTEGAGWKADCDVDPTPINSGTLTLDTVYFIDVLGTPNTFYAGDAVGDYFTSDGTENPDATNIVVALDDTYATCDGSQSAASDLEATEGTITNNKGYKITTVLDSISAGTITPVISSNPGVAVSAPATDVQNVKANGTDTAKIRANTAADGVKITSLTIEQYK